MVESGDGFLIFTWRGDKVNDALALIISNFGYSAWNEGLTIRVRRAARSEVLDLMCKIGESDVAYLAQMELNQATLIREKWDWALPRSVLARSFTSAHLDVSEARQVAIELSESGAT